MALSLNPPLDEKEAVVLGAQVSEILNSQAWERAVNALHEKYFNAWRNSVDPEVHRLTHAKIRALADIESEMRSILGNGTMLARKR